MARDVRAAGVIFILLIAGAECVRVKRAIPVVGSVVQALRSDINMGKDAGVFFGNSSNPVSASSTIEAARDTGAGKEKVASGPANQDWWPSWWGAGHEACPPHRGQTWLEWLTRQNGTDMSGQELLDRYNYKITKLLILIAGIKRENCTASCFSSWKQAQERMRQLESCLDLMRPGNAEAPDEFQKQDLRETAALKFATMGRHMSTILKWNGYLASSGNCGFHFDKLDMASQVARQDGSIDDFRKKIFGENCDQASRNEWLAGLSRSQVAFVETLEEEFDEQKAAQNKGAEPPEPNIERKVRRVAKAEVGKPIDDAGNPIDDADIAGRGSALQVGQGAEVDTQLLTIILAIVAGVILFCIMMFMLYMFVIVSAASAITKPVTKPGIKNPKPKPGTDTNNGDSGESPTEELPSSDSGTPPRRRRAWNEPETGGHVQTGTVGSKTKSAASRSLASLVSVGITAIFYSLLA